MEKNLLENRCSGISIYEHIKAHINPAGPGLLPGGEELPRPDIPVSYEDDDLPPDIEDYCKSFDIKWMPGFIDSVFSFAARMSKQDLSATIDSIIDAFARLGSPDNQEAVRNLEEVLDAPNTLAIIDDVLQRLVTRSDFNQTIIYHACKHLLLTSRRCGAVKFCTAITGLFGIPQDIDLFKTIARHEEFTLYAAVAVIYSRRHDAYKHWLEMARFVSGWGKIHLVNRLAGSSRPEVNEFLLKEGCKNDIAPECTALAVADAVKPENVLSKSKIDRETFKSCGLILKGLLDAAITKGPFWGIESYPGGFEALKNYLRHAESMARSVSDYLIIESISRLEKCSDLKWPKERKKEVGEEARRIISKKGWKEIILKEITATDPEARADAASVAINFGIDYKELFLDMLKKDPSDCQVWQILAANADYKLSKKILEIAANIIKEESRKESRVITLQSKRDTCLGAVLEMLYRFPGAGIDILKYSLESGDIKKKLVALKVLGNWQSDSITEEIYNAVKKSASSEDETLSISAENLIKRWSS